TASNNEQAVISIDCSSLTRERRSEMKKLGFVAGLLLLLAGPRAAWADPITLTFGELSVRPVNGLSLMGVTFGFQVGGAASTDAHYNGGGAGRPHTFVQCPCLEGDARGVLRLTFDTPTPLLSFGVALLTRSSLTPGFTVELFDAGSKSLGVFTVNTNPLILYSEGQFSYLGAPVSQAVITFNHLFPSGGPFNPSGNRFALDNLRYAPVTAANTVTSVSAASFSATKLTSEGIAAAFGTGLATTTQVATSLPLPTALAGTTVTVKDSAGSERLAPLFFVSPGQIN